MVLNLAMNPVVVDGLIFVHHKKSPDVSIRASLLIQVIRRLPFI